MPFLNLGGSVRWRQGTNHTIGIDLSLGEEGTWSIASMGAVWAGMVLVLT